MPHTTDSANEEGRIPLFFSHISVKTGLMLGGCPELPIVRMGDATGKQKPNSSQRQEVTQKYAGVDLQRVLLLSRPTQALHPDFRERLTTSGTLREVQPL